MTIDPETAAILGIVSSIFTTGISYGILKNTVNRLEKDFEKSENKHINFDHFHGVVEPMQTSIIEVQKDIKKILIIVSRNSLKEEE